MTAKQSTAAGGLLIATAAAWALAIKPTFAHDNIRSVTFEKAECEVDAGPDATTAPKFYACIAMRTNACEVFDGGAGLRKECHDSVKMLKLDAPIVKSVAREAAADWR